MSTSSLNRTVAYYRFVDGAGALVESGTRVRTRRAILDAAVSALTRNPQAALADIALVANVGRSTVHRYFPERSDLLAAIGTDATEKIAAATVRAPRRRQRSRRANSAGAGVLRVRRLAPAGYQSTRHVRHRRLGHRDRRRPSFDPHDRKRSRRGNRRHQIGSGVDPAPVVGPIDLVMGVDSTHTSAEAPRARPMYLHSDQGDCAIG